MKIYRFVLYVLGITLLAACQEPQDRVRIEGEIAGIKMADFYVYNEEELIAGVDTVKIVGGEFKYERPLAQPVVLTFLYPNFSRTYVVAEPGKKLKVRGEASKLGSLDISGSKDNELLTKFKLQNLKKSEKEAQMAAAQFVRDHVASMAALAVFKKYFVQAKHRNAAVALPLLKAMKKAQPDNPMIAILEGRLQDELQTAVGMTLPDFSAVSLKGDTVTRADFSQKPLLVVSWAPWSNECYRALKAVRALEKKYEGQLGILLLSIDFESKLSEIRVRQEGIKAPVVCEGKGFLSPLAKTLGVRYVTGSLLVNADGEIARRDVKVDELQQEVERWMK